MGRVSGIFRLAGEFIREGPPELVELMMTITKPMIVGNVVEELLSIEGTPEE